MKLVKLKAVQGSQNGAPAGIESLSPIPMTGLAPGPIQVRKVLHLDVDEILSRSLPKVSPQAVLSRDNQGSSK